MQNETFQSNQCDGNTFDKFVETPLLALTFLIVTILGVGICVTICCRKKKEGNESENSTEKCTQTNFKINGDIEANTSQGHINECFIETEQNTETPSPSSKQENKPNTDENDTWTSDANSKRTSGIDITKDGKDSGKDHIQDYCSNDVNTVTSQRFGIFSIAQKFTTSIYSKGSVFVLERSKDISKFVEKMLRDIKLDSTFIRSVDAEASGENRSIIIAGHASSRIDSDILGCFKNLNLKDSDIRRTVVVIINGFGNNEKDQHGEEIKPKSKSVPVKYKTLKGIVYLNFDCFQETDTCDKCLNARKALLNLVI